jgi:predicted transcriptional regulator
VAGKKTLALTDRQYAVLELLWEHGPMTVRDVLVHLPKGTPYTTALGLLQHMEKAGLVTVERHEPAHRYLPAQGRKETTRTLLRDFAKRFFRGSASRLALGLVETGELTSADLRELESLLPPQKDSKASKSRKGRS